MALGAANDGSRSARLAAGALFLAVLAACAGRPAPAAPGRAARPPGEGFFLSDDADEGFKLAYGLDGTDDVRVMLQCRPGSRKIDIVDAGHREARRGQALTLASGRARSALAPTLQTDEESQGVLVTAQASADLPALEAFRRSGMIAVKLGSQEYALSATPDERAEIARFFSLCERR